MSTILYTIFVIEYVINFVISLTLLPQFDIHISSSPIEITIGRNSRQEPYEINDVEKLVQNVIIRIDIGISVIISINNARFLHPHYRIISFCVWDHHAVFECVF
jgi:hypothetical protein